MVIGIDTVVTISPKQVYITLQLLEQRRMYQEYSDSLVIEREKLKMHISALQTLNKLKNEKTHLLELNLNKSDSINQLKEKRIELLNKSIRNEQSKKSRSFLTGTGFGLVIGAIILLIKG